MTGTQHPLRTLLIVDDDVEIIAGVSAQVENMGYRALTATSAAEALILLEKERPHAILCDIMMSGMTGIDFLSQLRSRGDQTPLAFLTGSDDRDYLLDAVRLGASDFLQKPFRFPELSAVIERVLEMGIKRQRVQETIEALKIRDPRGRS